MVHFIWPVITEKRFSLPLTKVDIHFGHVRMYERDFMDSLNHDNQADNQALNSTSRHLDDLLNIDNPYFEGVVNQIYPPELQLNQANTTDTEALFFLLQMDLLLLRFTIKATTLILIYA